MVRSWSKRCRRFAAAVTVFTRGFCHFFTSQNAHNEAETPSSDKLRAGAAENAGTADSSDTAGDAGSSNNAPALSGTVVNLKAHHGFIRPRLPLPSEYNRRKDVYFKLSSVIGPTVAENMTVCFYLSEYKEKPSATAVFKEGFDVSSVGYSRQNRASEGNRERGRVQRAGSSTRAESQDGTKRQASTLWQTEENSEPSQKASKTRSSKPASLLPHLGWVCAVKETFGFLKPEEKLPEDYGQKDVIFFLNKLRVANFRLVPGDALEFSLGTKDKEKPMALNAKLIKCCVRSDQDINSYLDSTTQQIKQLEPRTEASESEETEVQQSKYSLILELLSCSALVRCIGNTPHMSNSTVILVLELVVGLKDKTAGMEEQFRSLLSTLCETKFLQGLDSRLGQFIAEVGREAAGLALTKDFLRVLTQILPHKAGLVARLVKPVVSEEKSSTEAFLYDVLRQTARLTTEDVLDMDWNELPLVPSTSELLLTGPLESAINLSPVKVKGSYDSPHEYVDTYFRLLRADCFDAIRTGVHDLMKGKLDPRDMNVYHKVGLVGVLASHTEAGVQLALRVKPCKPVQDWSMSSNLMFGNLLCLTGSGTFKDTIWATVANRDEKLLKSKQVIIVELCSEGNSKNDADCITSLTKDSGSVLMVESPTYYRAYQPVLKALQTMDLESLPFQEELVNATDPSLLPDYVKDTTTVDGSIVYKSLPKECPVDTFLSHQSTSASDTTLDDSQQKAVKLALSARVGVIQGPPGTGKTFIGVQLVQLIRSMSTRPNSPILILTYKNHALDEFLKAMVELYPGGVVRVGGRCNEPELEAYNLNEIRRQQKKSTLLFREIQDIQTRQKYMQGRISAALKRLLKARSFSPQTVIDGFDARKLESLMKSCNWSQCKIEGPSDLAEILNKSFVCSLVDKYGPQLQALLKGEIQEKKASDAEKANYLLTRAMHVWMPRADVLHQVEKIASKLFQPSQVAANLAENAVNAATKGQNKRQKSRSDDDDGDERDLEDEEKERVSAILGSKNTSKTQEIMWIDHQSDNKMPHLLASSAVLLNDTPVAYWELLDDPWSLDEYDRTKLIQFLLLRQVKEAEEEVKSLLEEYQSLCRTKEELEDRHKVECMATKKVIGMTITGASICQRLLAQIKPAIVVVEEAAEVLESQLIAVLGKWVQQLILIGDHNQLPPSVECYTLATRFHFDVSMMERLINNKFEYASLSMQNRMRPEFAELLLDIYPGLKSNLARVSKNRAPQCMVKPMFFWNHTHAETKERSVRNEVEAEMVVQLALFLIQQEYEPSQITILGAYLGQVRLLRKLVRDAQSKHPHLFGDGSDSKADKQKKQTEESKMASISVHTIDLYQGDENKVVIVSLVRSNDKQQCGFLKKLNRRCVSQSRAKCGLYFVGNVKTLLAEQHWTKLIHTMNAQQCVGGTIELCCPKHRNSTVIRVSDAKEIPLGSPYCTEDCSEVMACKKHFCPQKCQPPHSHAKCMKKVAFLHQACSHPDQRYCYQDQSTLRCKKKIQFRYSACNHIAERCCHQTEAEVPCKEVCSRILTCSRKHPCEGRCGDPCDPKNCAQCAKIEAAVAEMKRKAEKEARELMRKETQQKIEEIKKSKSPDLFQRKNLSNYGDSASEFLDVKDQVMKYIQAGHNWYPTVTRIEKVTNLALEIKWLESKKKRVDPSRTALKFHGTSAEAVDCIVKTGFKIGKPGMYGAGVYFATDSSKSAQEIYTKGSNQLLVCEVLLGKSLTVEKAENSMTLQKLKAKGYDSLFAKRETKGSGGVLYDEFVVYDPDQAIPRYVVHYTRNEFGSGEVTATFDRGATSFKYYRITPKRELSLNDPLEHHFRMAESQFNRMRNGQQHNPMAQTQQYKVVSVDYYISPPLLARFDQQQARFERKYGPGSTESKFVLGFHGTNPQNIDPIVRNNFDVSKVSTCAHGRGLYFSEFPDVSMGYARGAQQLLLCKLLPGKSADVSGVGMTPLKADSHRVNKDAQGRGWAIVIDNSDQILPCYVITYS